MTKARLVKKKVATEKETNVRIQTKDGLIIAVSMSDFSDCISTGKKIINLRAGDKVVLVKTV